MLKNILLSVCAAGLLVGCGGESARDKATEICMERAKNERDFHSTTCRTCCGENGADPEIVDYDMPKDADHPYCRCHKK